MLHQEGQEGQEGPDQVGLGDQECQAEVEDNNLLHKVL
jgi:hypothetical protein